MSEQVYLLGRLHRKLKRQDHIFVCEDEFDFCKEHYGKPFINRQHFMKRMCSRAEVPHFGFHAIRHLTVSILYRLGKPVGVIQAILRHKSASTTERYLRSLGLEETRVHLEKLCGRGNIGKVIEMKSHLEKGSQVA